MTIVSDETTESAVDETIAGTSHGGAAETEIVPPLTQPEPGFAWSAENGYGDTHDWPESEDQAETELAPAVERRSWKRTGVYAALIGVVPAVLLVLVCGFPWDWDTQAGAPAAVVTPAAALPAAELPPISSAPVVTPPEDDEWVAGAISQTAVTRSIKDPSTTVAALSKAPTRQDALKSALQTCAKYTGNADCGVLNHGVYHGCIAYATDPVTGGFAAGSGPNERAAMQSAVDALGIPNPPGDSDCSTHAGERP